MHSATRTALIIGITGSPVERLQERFCATAGRCGLCIAILPRRRASTLPNSVQWLRAMPCGRAMSWRQRAGPTHRARRQPAELSQLARLALPIDNTIAAARISNARILLPATIYNFGANAPSVVTKLAADSTSRKGQVRRDGAEAAKAGLEGVRSIVVRGRFLGPGAGNSWLTRGMVRPRRVRSVYYPGPRK